MFILSKGKNFDPSFPHSVIFLTFMHILTNSLLLLMVLGKILLIFAILYLIS